MLKYIEKEMQGEELTRWHYRIGYSYFYLGENTAAQEHFNYFLNQFDKEKDEQVLEYLAIIELAKQENRSCAEVYNNGSIRVEDEIKLFRNILTQKSPTI